MTDTRVTSNKNVEVRLGVETAIANIDAATEAEINALVPARAAMRWDQFDLNVQASSMDEDPTLEDEAGAQMRALLQFGGTASFLTPKPGDTGIIKQIHDLVIVPHSKLVVAIRGVLPISTPAEAGQVWNLYRVITDAETHERADTGYSFKVNFRPLGQAGINAIVPSSPATSVTLTPVGGSTATIGKPLCLNALYEGNDITVGAQYTSSDDAVLEPLPHGWAIPKTAGTASITATYPGSAPGTPLSITVS
ncbi:hypothetical protein G7068_16160 [Leucobacter viscericola]|uniref:Uncharacterized protein n=1 Tax=Leucobacter viscericola TaxID=2714935 RepID=A0A6G7XBH5_9MICO|nr:hypothetical protein [Leucobacter viscericola]QIK61799.1 hypothetical protein G7068_00170 [Leucobacter viscericola]QIK64581.1 hypothetical protein G7068_16160 [Leucobacter viscericola]